MLWQLTANITAMLSPPFDLLQRSLDFRSRGDLEGAIKILTEGIDSLSPSEFGAELCVLTHDLALLCEMAGRTPLGIQYAMRGLVSSPQDLGLLYTVTRLLILAGRTDDARVSFKKFLAACEISTDELRSGWAELRGELERKLTGLIDMT